MRQSIHRLSKAEVDDLEVQVQLTKIKTVKTKALGIDSEQTLIQPENPHLELALSY